MTTDLAVRGGADLAAWAEEARLVHQIAVSLAGTSFVPRSMQGRPDEVAGAILAGRELGLSPMASLRAIDVIDGTPALRALALRALVQSEGHQVWVEESTETRAMVCGRRKGEAQVQRSVWTMERARKAGLAGKKNWTTMPTAMLVARATAEVCRLVGSDKILAVPFVAEELSDDLAPDGAAPAPTGKTGRRTAQRKALPARPAPEPDLVPPPKVPYVDKVAAHAVPEGPSLDAVPVDEPVPEMTDNMRRALMASYREIGITDRDERLKHASRIVGRPVGSANELTHAEAHDLLAALEAEAARVAQDREAEGTDGHG